MDSAFSWHGLDGFYWSNGLPPGPQINAVVGEIVGPGGAVLDPPNGESILVFLEDAVTVRSLQTLDFFDLSSNGFDLTVNESTDLAGFLSVMGSQVSLGDFTQYDPLTGRLDAGTGLALSDGEDGDPGILEFNGANIVINNTALNLSGPNFVIRDQITGLDALRNFARNDGVVVLDDGASVVTPGNFINDQQIFLAANPSVRVPVFTVSGNLQNNGEIWLQGNSSFSVAGGYSGSGQIFTSGSNNQISVVGAFIQSGGDLDVDDEFDVTSDLELNGNLTLTEAGAVVRVGGDLRGNNSLTIMKGDGTEIVVTGDILQTGGKIDTGPSGVDASILRARTMTYQNNACISGEGKLITGNVNINNSFLTPGNTPGQLEIEGSLTITGSSDLEIELGGTVQGETYDHLIQSGGTTGLTLGGTLTIKLVDGFECELMGSDTFTVVTSDMPISGAFMNVADGERLETSDGLGTFIVRYGTNAAVPNAVVLSDFVAAPVATVSFNDWAINQGFLPDTLPNGDADGNGVPDILQYFSGASSGVLPKQTLTIDESQGLMVWTFGVPKTVTGITPRTITMNQLPAFEIVEGPLPQLVATTATKNIYRVEVPLASPRQFLQLVVELD
ncbi:MAG: hypothetical protein WBG04_21305 [Haloferula sp.]